MSEERKNESDPATPEDAFGELLRRAQVTFMGGQSAPSAGAAASDGDAGRQAGENRLARLREFRLKPREVREYLDRFVIRQDEAKKALSVAICDHFHHVRRCLTDSVYAEREHAKHNILLLGPTGVGKTYLLRCIARLIGVPMVKADATKFSETGYVGHDVEDLLRDLVKAADGDVTLAECGIIYLDEVDKIASQASTSGRDVSGRGVQVNLLKLMEETEVGLFSQTDLLGQMQAVMELQRGRAAGRRTINSRHVLFIASGAFPRLAEQVRRRLRASPIGFAAEGQRESSDAECLRAAGTRDLIDYGFEPEFVGRLPVRVVCDPLDEGDLEAIMRGGEGNVLTQYEEAFRAYGIALKTREDAYGAVARLAHAEQTGARGLTTVLERTLREFKFELPSAGFESVEFGADTVSDPSAVLRALLANGETRRRGALTADLESFARDFAEQHGVDIVFTPDAAERLVDLCLAGNLTMSGLCRTRFRDLEYGLKLISRNTGETRFELGADMVDRPEETLARRIAVGFGRKA